MVSIESITAQTGVNMPVVRIRGPKYVNLSPGTPLELKADVYALVMNEAKLSLSESVAK